MTTAIIAAITTSALAIIGAVTTSIMQIQAHKSTVATMTQALQQSQPTTFKPSTKPPFTGE